MRPLKTCLLSLALAACVAPAQSSTEFGGEWHLIALEGEPVPAALSINFVADGKVTGQAPCNKYFGTYSGDLPDLSFGPLASTEMACPDLATESALLGALQVTKSGEISEGHLYLVGKDDRVLEFVRDPAKDSTCLSCLARM